MGNCYCPKRPADSNDVPDSYEDQEQMINPVQFYNRIVKVQAVARGYITRKKCDVKKILANNQDMVEALYYYADQYLTKYRGLKLQPLSYTLDKAQHSWLRLYQSDANFQFVVPENINYKEDCYIGEQVDKLRHGRGIQVWEDGSFYEGYWYNNVVHGYGRLIQPDGSYYIGQWNQGITDGKGQYHLPNGTVYDGN